MATASQINSFIEQIAPCAQKAYKEVGKVLPSVCIGMACVECGYGTAGSVKHHSYLGHKVGSGKTATKYWGGKFFTSKTSEEYTVGTHTVINAAFRAYDSMEQCVFNYYELLNTSLYAKVKAGVDYTTQMQQVKACGYMTSSTEVNSVISIIKKYNLTQYDTASGTVTPAPSIAAPYTYIVGKNYTLQANMYVRDAANGGKKTYTQLTTNAKSHAAKQADGSAVLKKGTVVTVKAMQEVSGAMWLKIPSGWVCGYSASGKLYVK